MQEDQRDVREKCERFRQSIMQRANAQIAEIDRKLKEYRVSELGKYEDDARGDSAHLLEEESRRIETAAAHAVSERRAELRRQLYERRIQLTDEVFQKAEESLSEFVSGQEYSEFLRQKAEKAGKLRKDGEPRFAAGQACRSAPKWGTAARLRNAGQSRRRRDHQVGRPAVCAGIDRLESR